MDRDTLDDLWHAIDTIPDAPDLETMTAADITRLAYELECAAIALHNATQNFSHNAREALDPDRYHTP